MNLKCTDQDGTKIHDIAIRAKAIFAKLSILDTILDLNAAHLNGCPLDLDRMLTAGDSDLMHDVRGINRHLDRETGKLKGKFMPRFALRIDKPEEPEPPPGVWIKIAPGCRLPKPEKNVLVWHATPRRGNAIVAIWVPKHHIEDNSDSDNGGWETEYDEDTDMYYWPEGWYSSNYEEETHWVLENVTHWQPLPGAPEEET